MLYWGIGLITAKELVKQIVTMYHTTNLNSYANSISLVQRMQLRAFMRIR